MYSSSCPNIPKAYIPKMPPVGGYPYTQMPLFVGLSPNNEPNSGVSPTDSILMSKLEDLTKQEKVKESSFEQASDVKVQQRYCLLKQRLRVIEGEDIYKVIDTTELSLVPDLVISQKFKVPDFT